MPHLIKKIYLNIIFMNQMYVISIHHPRVTGQWDIVGVNRDDCMSILDKRLPLGGYKIIREGLK
jgi:mitochondrial fission protein ELM1